MNERCRPPLLPTILMLIAMVPVAASGQGIPGFFEPANSDPQYPFYHGVASGDATTYTVVLWTRLSFVNEETPFVAFGTVEVATDTAFTDIVASQQVQTHDARDWCVKADVDGLEPDSWYYYRFRFDVFTTMGPVERTSITGRTKTLPGPGALPECGRWRAAAVSCLNFQSGHFNALGAIAARNDLDAVIALGDQIYEYYSAAANDNEYQRYQWPEAECVQSHQYAQRWLTQRLDPDMQAASQQLPWYVMWDDHEVANEAFADGSQYHNAATQGDYLDRKAAALRTFFLWNPIREAEFQQGPDQLNAYELHCYRSFYVGPLVKLMMLDTRTFRSQWVALQPDILTLALDITVLEDSATAATLAPLLASLSDTSRTILGDDQKAWLEGSLTPQQMGVWNLFAQQVLFTPLPVVDLAEYGLPPYPLSNPGNGIVDKWDGYQADRDWLIDRLAPLSNPVVLTGDIHQEFAFEIPDPAGGFVDAGGVQAGSVGTEFTATSVVSDPRVWPLTEEAAQQLIPWLEHGDIDNPLSRGFSVLDFTMDRLQVDFVQATELWERTPASFLSTSFVVPADDAVPLGGAPRFAVETGIGLDTADGCAPLQPTTMEAWVGWSPPGWGHPDTPNGLGPTPGFGAAGHDPLHLWLDAEGRLQANADLVEVQWHDAHGRLLPGPVGPGPWLVHATAADGRTARRLLR